MRIKKNLSLLSNFISSLYGIFFISLTLATVTISIASIFLFSEKIKKIKNEAYMTSIKSTTNNAIYNARLYNDELEKMYKEIDYKFLNRIFNTLKSLGEDPLKIPLGEIEKISRKENISITLINYSSTKVEMTSNFRLRNLILKKHYPTFQFEFTLLKPDKIKLRFASNPFLKEIILYSTLLTKNKKFVWSVGKPFAKLHPLMSLIKKLRVHNYRNDTFSKKIGLYSEERLANHKINKVKLPSVLDDKLFNKKCDSFYHCVIWKKIPTPQGIESNQFIKYIGLEFNGQFQLKNDSIIYSSMNRIILLSLFLSLLFSFIISKLLTRDIYKILGSIKLLRKNIEARVKIPKVWNNELNQLSSTINILIKKLFEKNSEAKKTAREILSAKDKERRSISRDLHDSVGQLLVAANLRILENKTKEAEDIITLASEELRNIYDELEPRSLEKMNFEDAIEWYLLKFFSKDFPYHINAKLSEKIPSGIKIQIYRIIQETIANIKKHAPDSQSIDIEIYENSKQLIIKIRNETKIRPKKTKVYFSRGLKNIKLRAESLAGKMTIKQSNESFEIKVCFDISFKTEG